MKNEFNLKAGDVVKFTNSSNFKMEMKVTRVTEKSWYASTNNMGNSRNSFGTLKKLSRYSDFKIVRSSK